jgi:hypothetical protein
VKHSVRLNGTYSRPNPSRPGLVSGIDYLNKSVEIHKELEIKGGLKVLKDRGIRITSYSEHSRSDKTNEKLYKSSVELDLESENVRRESKLSVPDRNIEPALATTPGIDRHRL